MLNMLDIEYAEYVEYIKLEEFESEKKLNQVKSENGIIIYRINHD